MMAMTIGSTSRLTCHRRKAISSDYSPAVYFSLPHQTKHWQQRWVCDLYYSVVYLAHILLLKENDEQHLWQVPSTPTSESSDDLKKRVKGSVWSLLVRQIIKGKHFIGNIMYSTVVVMNSVQGFERSEGSSLILWHVRNRFSVSCFCWAP